jgi:hypothetical protein
VIVSTHDKNARAIRGASETLLVAWPYPEGPFNAGAVPR